jgi:hypothetical protein
MITVDIPGALDCFLGGTGAMQGQLYSNDPDEERGAQELRAAYRGGRHIRRGRGYTLRVELPSIEAAVVLAEYADTCIHSNLGGDDDASERRAAVRTLERIAAATDGRVAWDGWNVLLDGQPT